MWLGLGSVLMAVAITVVVIHFAAKLKTHVSEVKTGTIELVVAGQTLLRVLSNVPGYRAEYQSATDHWKMVVSTARRGGPMGYLERRWGIFWVSLWYPLRQVLTFSLPSADRLVDESKLAPGYHIKQRIEYVNEKPNVQFLLFQFPHPVFIPEVELGLDGARADFVVNTILEVEDPGQAVLIHGGRFFQTVNQVMQGVVGDFATKLSYEKLRQLPKGAGAPASSVTAAGETIAELAIVANDHQISNTDQRTLRQVTGIKIINAWIVDYNLTGASADLLAASQQEAVEESRARGAKKRGEGAAQEILARAGAESQRIRVLAESLTQNGASGDAAAAVVGTILRTENIGKMSGLGTYVEGGGTGMVAIQPASRPSPPPAAPTPPAPPPP